MAQKRRGNGEGTITQRKDGRWMAQYTDNAGKRRTIYGKKKIEVQIKLKEAIRDSDAGLQMDKSKMKFTDWMIEWLEDYKKPMVRESTYAASYSIVHHHIIPAFPNVLIKDLQLDALQKFINSKLTGGRVDKMKDSKTGKWVTKPGGLSMGSIVCIKQVLVQALNQAVENGMIISNIACKIKLPNRSNDEVKVLSAEEQEKLEKVLINAVNPLAFVILLDLYTGLRRGELMGLKISDIDLEKKEITIRRTKGRVNLVGRTGVKTVITEPKTAKGKRTIPLPDFIADKLKSYIDDRNKFVEVMAERWSKNSGLWQDEGFLFITQLGTQPGGSCLEKLLDQYLKTAGIGHIKFHALRHTFTTRCVEKGFDVKTLSEILGHTDTKTTLKLYTHSLEEQKRLNMGKLTPVYSVSDNINDNNKLQ